MKTSGRVVFGSLLALLLAFGGAAQGATLVYDFLAPGAAGLSGSETGTYTVGGVPLFIEAGSLDSERVFERGGFGATLAVIQPQPFFNGGGLGVLSSVPSGSSLEEGLSRDEGLLFRFSPGFEPTRFTLSGFTYGTGSGAFEGVRIILNGVYVGYVLGEFDGTVTIPLPAGVTTLALSPLLDFQTVTLSSDPTFFVASIEGNVLFKGVLDIKPGSCENPLNVRSRGVLPAAILGTGELDAAGIDPASVRLAGVAPVRSSLGDVGTPGDCGAGPDGIPDLVLKFDTEAIVQAIAARLGPIQNRRTVVLPFEAKLRDGSMIRGEDAVLLIVPGGK